jgi:UDP-N-acetylglucosamine 2-epimerase (non-hydrolysing)
MLQQINGYFKIKPDIDLDLMQQNQSLPALSSVVMETVTQVLVNHRPHVVVVQVMNRTHFSGTKIYCRLEPAY